MEVEEHHYPISRFHVHQPFYVLIDDGQRSLHLGVAPVTGDLLVSVRTKPMVLISMPIPKFLCSCGVSPTTLSEVLGSRRHRPSLNQSQRSSETRLPIRPRSVPRKLFRTTETIRRCARKGFRRTGAWEVVSAEAIGASKERPRTHAASRARCRPGRFLGFALSLHLPERSTLGSYLCNLGPHQETKPAEGRGEGTNRKDRRTPR